MKDKQIRIFRTISILSLAAALIFTVWAYFKMDKVFVKAEMSMMSIDFQIFVFGIIISAFTSFYITWRLLLNIVIMKADYRDDLHKKDINVKKEQEEEVVEDLIDWENIITNDSIKTTQNLCRKLEIDIARKFELDKSGEFINTANYSYIKNEDDNSNNSFKLGEGLNGEVAQRQKGLLLNEIPENYITITSGSGQIVPSNIYIIPIIVKGKTKCIFELADMKSDGKLTFNRLEQFAIKLANTIK